MKALPCLRYSILSLALLASGCATGPGSFLDDVRQTAKSIRQLSKDVREINDTRHDIRLAKRRADNRMRPPETPVDPYREDRDRSSEEVEESRLREGDQERIAPERLEEGSNKRSQPEGAKRNRSAELQSRR